MIYLNVGTTKIRIWSELRPSKSESTTFSKSPAFTPSFPSRYLWIIINHNYTIIRISQILQ